MPRTRPPSSALHAEGSRSAVRRGRRTTTRQPAQLSRRRRIDLLHRHGGGGSAGSTTAVVSARRATCEPQPPALGDTLAALTGDATRTASSIVTKSGLDRAADESNQPGRSLDQGDRAAYDHGRQHRIVACSSPAAGPRSPIDRLHRERQCTVMCRKSPRPSAKRAQRAGSRVAEVEMCFRWCFDGRVAQRSQPHLVT